MTRSLAASIRNRFLQNYAHSSAYLKRHPHDICLVTDGDADRVGGMDGRGNPLVDAPD